MEELDYFELINHLLKCGPVIWAFIQQYRKRESHMLERPIVVTANSLDEAFKRAQAVINEYDKNESQTWYLSLLEIQYESNTENPVKYLFNRGVRK